MPLANWRKCISGDMTGVRIEGKKGNDKDDLIQWEMCYDSYISRFGLPTEYSEYLDLLKKKALAEIDFIQTGQRYKLNVIRHLQAGIDKRMLNDGEDKTDYYGSALTSLRKYLGFWIQDTVIKTEEFFETMEEYNKWVKQQNAAHGKDK